MFHKCSTGGWANTAAAIQPKQGRGTYQKTCYKTFSQPDPPDCSTCISLRQELDWMDASEPNMSAAPACQDHYIDTFDRKAATD